MVFKQITVVLSVVCLVSCVSQIDITTLHQVHVIFRHGEKTPEKVGVYPKDPYSNESYWHPYGFGSLTNKGMKQSYNVGKLLRSRYNDFLGKIYRPDKLYARSTNFDRTKMSLQLVLAGLWPPTSVQLWNNLIPWQPIPYEYEPMERDKLMKFPMSYCKNYQDEYLKARNREEIYKFFRDNSETIDFINTNTGLNCTTNLDLLVLYFVLQAEVQYGLKLPVWTQSVYPDFLEKAAALEYELQTYSDDMLRAGGGHLIKKIIEDARAKIDHGYASRSKLIYLYSGHEFNIVQVLASLRLFNGKIPPTSAYLIIEMHKINNQYGFKVFYQDYSQNNLKLLRVPGCEDFCDFDKFLNIVYNILPLEDTC